MALLSSSAEIEIRDRGRRPPSAASAIRPGHVAVLVRTHRNAALIRDALDDVDVPAVINGAGSVFGTAPARDWLRLLEALERPDLARRAASAALTSFLGWTTEQVAAADDDDWEEVHRRLHEWARVLRVKGVASLTETITLVEGLPERVLRSIDGERRLTDLRHVGQLLHAAATAEQLGTTALTAWLRQQINAAGDDTSDEERSRRLESDAEAVQVLTIHRSKGLEFPIVYYPYLWEPGWIPNDPQPVFFHDPDADDARTIDVGLDGPDFPGHRRQHEVEQRGEDLRLAYVALTRAQHQAVVWWAGSWDSRHSALGRLLFARDADGNVPPAGVATPKDAAAVARFEALAPTRPAASASSGRRSGRRLRGPVSASQPAELSAARFDRDLDWRWRRTSYSDITAGTLRGAGGERARGERRRRRGAAGGAGGPACRTKNSPRCCAAAVAAGGDAGRRPRRHVRAPRASRRPTSPPPTSTPSSPRTSPPPRAPAPSRSATRRRWSPACAPRSRRRSARCSAARGCATSRAPTASTSSTSSCRSSAATSRPGG